MRAKKNITVRLTFDWTFDERDWIEEKKHREDLKDNPKIVLGVDTINSIYSLNDIAYPSLVNAKVVTND